MISTHILDLNSGSPAENVTVTLEKQEGESWSTLKEARTNGDGRISYGCAPEAGIYRLNFQIDEYFQSKNLTAFFIVAPVIFKISDIDRKYHVPLLLNQYGYSTYRGS